MLSVQCSTQPNSLGKSLRLVSATAELPAWKAPHFEEVWGFLAGT